MRPFRNQPFVRPQNDLGHLIYMGIAVIFWAAVIFGIVMLLNRYARRNDPNHVVPEDPLAIAKIRYAKGEITKEEFTQIKKDLA